MGSMLARRHEVGSGYVTPIFALRLQQVNFPIRNRIRKRECQHPVFGQIPYSLWFHTAAPNHHHHHHHHYYKR